MDMVNICKLKRLDKNAQVPTYGTDGAGCFDLYACKDQIVQQHTTAIIKLGWAVEVPEGHMLVICPRSSIGVKTPLRMANSVGIIDCDYRGEIGAIYHNASDKPHMIYQGDRIAQGYITPVKRTAFTIVDSLSDTKRGLRGYGSTGR